MFFHNNSHHKGKILDPIFHQFKVALNSNYIFFLTLPKVTSYSIYSTFLKQKFFRLKFSMFLASHTVTMVMYCGAK